MIHIDFTVLPKKTFICKSSTRAANGCFRTQFAKTISCNRLK